MGRGVVAARCGGDGVWWRRGAVDRGAGGRGTVGGVRWGGVWWIEVQWGAECRALQDCPN